MLRRALIFLCLAAPPSALAQANSLALNNVDTPTKVVYGRSNCVTGGTDDPNVFISWTLNPTSTTGTNYATGDAWRLSAASSDTCATADANTIATITPGVGAKSGRYPDTSGTIKLSVIRGKAGVTCSETVDQTITLCIALRRTGTATDETSFKSNFKIQLTAPLKPTGLAVGPGDSALNLSWTAPDTASNPAATSYEISVVAVDPADDSVTHTYPSSGTSRRADGLVNDVTYNVAVTSVSEGGNRSADAATGSGTPRPVKDFWEICKADSTCVEQGGCAGGAAGLLSLLGVAMALRLARRRS